MQKLTVLTSGILLVLLLLSCTREANLSKSFDDPPASSRPSCFWWWFNSLVDKEGIRRDLQEFKAKGMGGVTLVCSGNDYGVADMPKGPEFLSPKWFELYRYTLDEAARLGLEVGVNFGGGGWCIGGKWITPELNSRWFVQADTTVSGPQLFSGRLPLPDPRGGYKAPHYGNVTHYMTWSSDKMDYRLNAVVAFRMPKGQVSLPESEGMKLLDAKSNRRDASIFIDPDDAMGLPLTEWKHTGNDNPVAVSDILDLSSKVKSDGSLDWKVPDGQWKIITTGHVATGADVRCVLPELGYVLEIDWLNPASMDFQFKNLGELLIKEAGPHAGKTLKFFHSDSFEDGYPNWTDNLLNKFREYRGYDPVPYLPVFKGWIVGSTEISDRFLYDYRKTVADCFADGSYGRLAELSHAKRLLLQSEAAGPSWSGTVCFDALKNLGKCDYPMGEFWMYDGLTRNGQNFVGKQTATASHIYGKKTASAEAFTGGEHWQQSPEDLKPVADRAFCEGINRMVFHTMTSTRPEDGLPGYEYGAGTHFNPNVTWWDQAAGSWLAYINRCQALLQSGLFVADVLCYNGDWAPNLVREKHIDPSLGKGYDYDVCNAEVLMNRLTVRNGLITLPDGMKYRLLVLPETRSMPVEVLEKIRDLVEAGATVVGPEPEKDPGLRNYPHCDEEIKTIAAALWGNDKGTLTGRQTGKGRVIYGRPLREILKSEGVSPDFECISEDTSAFIDFIHRRTDEAEIYFLANRHNSKVNVNATFRVNGRRPELWDAVTGVRRSLPGFTEKNGRTSVPLEFGPHGSMFIVFPDKPSPGLIRSKKNFISTRVVRELTGPWDVQFDTAWLYPVDRLSGVERHGHFVFTDLEDWSVRNEDALRFFSGTATYRKTIQLKNSDHWVGAKVFLSLGEVHETARIIINGKDAGVLWCNPWKIEISSLLKTGENILEIEVVNLWPNRLIGDQSLPVEKRQTHTNVISYKNDSPLMPSGLIGPVRVELVEK